MSYLDRLGVEESGVNGGRLDRLWPLLYVIFLPNFVPPVDALFRAHPAPLRVGVVLGGAGLFVAVYLWAAWHSELNAVGRPISSAGQSAAWRWGPVVLLLALSVALIVDDGTRWMSLLIFTSACTGGRLPLGRALRAIAVLTVFTALLGWATADSASDIGNATFWVFMAGLLTVILSHLRRTIGAVRAAREEIARLAVETERLRFARDLHDLLGHDLARIALQSEVAEALVSMAPERAAATMREIGGSARTALQEVRAAVAGYRQPTLASELRGAEQILTAAGISYCQEGAQFEMPPALEAVLAWAVREGVTNVVKYSRARHCTIVLTQGAAEAAVEVIDDGQGVEGDAAPRSTGAGGTGLAGLAERATASGGTCEAAPAAAGGFRLKVSVPVEREGREQPAVRNGKMVRRHR